MLGVYKSGKVPNFPYISYSMYSYAFFSNLPLVPKIQSLRKHSSYLFLFQNLALFSAEFNLNLGSMSLTSWYYGSNHVSWGNCTDEKLHCMLNLSMAKARKFGSLGVCHLPFVRIMFCIGNDAEFQLTYLALQVYILRHCIVTPFIKSIHEDFMQPLCSFQLYFFKRHFQ